MLLCLMKPTIHHSYVIYAFVIMQVYKIIFFSDIHLRYSHVYKTKKRFLNVLYDTEYADKE